MEFDKELERLVGQAVQVVDHCTSVSGTLSAYRGCYGFMLTEAANGKSIASTAFFAKDVEIIYGPENERVIRLK